MKTTTEYWKNWFNERAKNATSDYILNRGTTLRLNELETRSHQQFLEAVDPKPTDVVLDAGCGSGRNISTLSASVKSIVGVDFSNEMLAKAAERVAAEKLTNVKMIAGSVTELEFADDTFDKAVCASVLQYLDDGDCEAAFREMVRVCKNHGTMVLHVKNGTSLYAVSLKFLRMIFRLVGKEVMPEHYRSRAWHEKTLLKCGAVVADYDAFGIFTFVPLPGWAVQRLLQWELKLVKGKWLKKFGVNYKITARIEKRR